MPGTCVIVAYNQGAPVHLIHPIHEIVKPWCVVCVRAWLIRRPSNRPSVAPPVHSVRSVRACIYARGIILGMSRMRACRWLVKPLVGRPLDSGRLAFAWIDERFGRMHHSTSVPGADGKSRPMCAVCGHPSTHGCPHCGLAYCHSLCQRSDWARHSLECDHHSNSDAPVSEDGRPLFRSKMAALTLGISRERKNNETLFRECVAIGVSASVLTGLAAEPKVKKPMPKVKKPKEEKPKEEPKEKPKEEPKKEPKKKPKEGDDGEVEVVVIPDSVGTHACWVVCCANAPPSYGGVFFGGQARSTSSRSTIWSPASTPSVRT